MPAWLISSESYGIKEIVDRKALDKTPWSVNSVYSNIKKFLNVFKKTPMKEGSIPL